MSDTGSTSYIESEGEGRLDPEDFERLAIKLEALHDSLPPREQAVLRSILLLAEGPPIEPGPAEPLVLGNAERKVRLEFSDGAALRSSLAATVGKIVRQPRFGPGAQPVVLAWMDRD